MFVIINNQPLQYNKSWPTKKLNKLSREQLIKNSLSMNYAPGRKYWLQKAILTYLSDVNFSILVVIIGLKEALLELGEHSVGDSLQHKKRRPR